MPNRYSQLRSSPLFQQSGLNFSPRSIWLFIALGTGAWSLNILGQAAFPSQNTIPYIFRTTITALIVIFTIIGNIRLLKQNHLPTTFLGLDFSRRSFFNFLLGACIGILSLSLMGLILYLFVPFHFSAGTLNGSEILKESYSYFWGNFLEELIFRGFLLIALSNRIGWHKAVWVMALAFGSFHLPGTGFGIAGLKMVVTTATYSLIFSYAFILTGSLWTAIGVHVISNILLHTITGLDGANKAMLRPTFNDKLPINYDVSFLTFLITTTIVSFFLFLLIKANNRNVDIK
ncbi:CPBP family intramembrane metalloprotease [Chitinophaga oryziterrae]|uniref:CPBP family intramembrane metalloprotease n=1 Tax=Chitinophaga oryziterrae TaxID=1031224 RepID=A0A6N8J8J9_9BACT|nr:type II CAAX endopeptidase family protein [Chitinophaga oryziterrae]MVT41605.1 CPBP family intramembrane metalloprotease [Chitinophaga oryziterrae]